MSYPPQSPLFIRSHLGLGDALIQNGLVRNLAAKGPVIFPAKHHNVPSVQFMFRDDPNITVLPVKDDTEADALCLRHPGEVLKLGMFGENFSFKDWDRVIYSQANVPFEERWGGFHVERDKESEYVPPYYRYAFVHDDRERGLIIDTAHIQGIGTVRPGRRDHIFQWWGLIENATEIHVIDSAFLSMVESVKTNATRFVLHRYARPNSKDNGYAGPPTLRKNWEVIS